MAAVGLKLAPVDEEAVGPAGEGAVEVHGVAGAQAAAVVVAGSVEPGVESGFDAPMIDVCLGLLPLKFSRKGIEKGGLVCHSERSEESIGRFVPRNGAAFTKLDSSLNSI